MPGAVGAEQPEHLTRVDVQAHVVVGEHVVAEALGDGVDLEKHRLLQQRLAATDDAVVDAAKHVIGTAHGTEDADAVDRGVGEIGADAVGDAEHADDEQRKPAATAARGLELDLRQELVADHRRVHDPLDGLVVGLEHVPDAAADDVGAAGEQPLRDEHVDLPELGGGKVDADLLGLHLCSSWNPDWILAGTWRRRKGRTVDHASMATKAPPKAPPVEEVARRTLRALIERLHPAVLDVLVAPVGLDREVGDPVILDPVEESLPPADSVVLAVGVDSPRAQAALLDRLE